MCCFSSLIHHVHCCCCWTPPFACIGSAVFLEGGSIIPVLLCMPAIGELPSWYDGSRLLFVFVLFFLFFLTFLGFFVVSGFLWLAMGPDLVWCFWVLWLCCVCEDSRVGSGSQARWPCCFLWWLWWPAFRPAIVVCAVCIAAICGGDSGGGGSPTCQLVYHSLSLSIIVRRSFFFGFPHCSRARDGR